jgi:hypothetical protein
MDDIIYQWQETQRIDNRCNFETYLKHIKTWISNAPDEFWEKMERRYPTINIDNETYKAYNWITEHEKRRIKRIRRFLTNWYFLAELYKKRK